MGLPKITSQPIGRGVLLGCRPQATRRNIVLPRVLHEVIENNSLMRRSRNNATGHMNYDDNDDDDDDGMFPVLDG